MEQICHVQTCNCETELTLATSGIKSVLFSSCLVVNSGTLVLGEKPATVDDDSGSKYYN